MSDLNAYFLTVIIDIEYVYLSILRSLEARFRRSLRESITRQTQGNDMEARMFWGRLNEKGEDLADFNERARPYTNARWLAALRKDGCIRTAVHQQQRYGVNNFALLVNIMNL